jgi:hypothetical protein
MKKILIACLLTVIISFTAFSQQSTIIYKSNIPYDTVTKKITYTEVVTQQGTPDTLYNRAIHWCGIYFKNAQSVTSVRDQPSGKIEGIYRFKVYNQPDKEGTKTEAGVVSYTFTIECKENKFRYKIYDFNLKGISYFALERWLDKTDKSYIPLWDYYLTQVDENMKEFTKSLKKGMVEATKVSDDW